MAKITRTVVISGTTHWIRANTEQEYANKLLELISYKPPEVGKHPFSEYAWNWFETYSKPNVSTATEQLYKRLFMCHIMPAFERLAVEDIKLDDIQRMFNGMNTSKETKYKVKRLLNQVLNAAVDDEFLMKSPLKSDRIKITGAESTTTAVYSVEQMQYLVQRIGDIEQPLDRTYMAIQALHPLRLEEVLGGNSPLSYTQVRRMCERIQKDIGFTEKITPKRFRTTVLTDLYDKTRDIKLVQAAAGHTTADMTLKHYVKGRGNVVKSAAAIESAYTA